jgi:hypothetical protein
MENEHKELVESGVDDGILMMKTQTLNRRQKVQKSEEYAKPIENPALLPYRPQ